MSKSKKCNYAILASSLITLMQLESLLVVGVGVSGVGDVAERRKVDLASVAYKFRGL